MRRYILASQEARGSVDLRQHTNMIINAVHAVMPQAVVVVEKQYYTVDPAPNRSEAIRIGRKLSKAQALGRYCIKIPKLFNSEEIGYGEKECNG